MRPRTDIDLALAERDARRQRRLLPGTIDGRSEMAGAVSARTTNAVIASGGSGSGSLTTVVIAASDSTPESKAGADFVCSGTDDQDVIHFAIEWGDTVHASATRFGCELVFLEGTYNLSAPIDLSYAAGATTATTRWDMKLRGMGWGTVFSVAALVDGALVNSGSINDVEVRDIYFVNEGTDSETGCLLSAREEPGWFYSYDVIVRDCMFEGFVAGGVVWDAVDVGGYGWQIVGCRFVDCGGLSTTAAIWITGLDGSLFHACHIVDNESDNALWYSLAFYNVNIDVLNIAGNLFAAGIYIECQFQFDSVTIAGNRCTDLIVEYPTHHRQMVVRNNLFDLVVIWRVETNKHQFGAVTFTGNYVHEELFMYGCDRSSIVGNYMNGAGIDTAVDLNNMRLVNFTGNYVRIAGSAFNARCMDIDAVDHSVIAFNYFMATVSNTGAVGMLNLLSTNCDRNLVSSNIFRSNGLEDCDWAVRIQAGSNENRIVMNDWLGAYAVAGLLDGGTGTVTTPANA